MYLNEFFRVCLLANIHINLQLFFRLMEEVLAKIRPTVAQKKAFLFKVNAFISVLQPKLAFARVILGGSGAKDTWLYPAHDADIFVVYDYSKYADKSAQLSDLLENVLRTAFPAVNMVRLHGSRDYFQLTMEALTFEVVPILKITTAQEARNITDISPLHCAWVNAKAKNLKDEIRLAKQFVKAAGLYGAESYIAGFSGYILEILVVYYGSFEKLLLGAIQWKEPQIIDVEKYYPRKMALFELNQSKLQSPLIVIDPVDKSRNAAAALSKEKFDFFKARAKAFLKKRSTNFFVCERLNFEMLRTLAKRRKQVLVFAVVEPFAGKKDVVGSKLLKVFEQFRIILMPFGIVSQGWEWESGTASMYFMVKNKVLPTHFIRKGPPVSMAEAVRDFMKQNKDTFVEDGVLFARVPHEMRMIEEVLTRASALPFVKERIRRVVELKYS